MRNLDDIHRIERKPGNSNEFQIHRKPQIHPHIIPAIESNQFHAQSPETISQTKKRSYKVALMTVFTMFVLGVGAFFGGRFVSLANDVSSSHQGIYKTVTDNIGAALGPFIPGLKGLDNSSIAQAIREGRRVNILLLGYGGPGHDGGYLTDTMMLLSVDFANNTATYIPVPRDTWVKIPTHGYDGPYAKINSAYAIGLDSKNYSDKLPQFQGADGGGNMSKYEVSQVLGVPVDYYASVDFYAFKDIVNILGGVEVNVQNAFTDYSYPSGDQNVAADYCVAEDIPDDLIQNCRFKKVHFDAGLQFMDGARALEYSRSRHAAGAEGSDYARSARQQNLITAIEKKALSVGALTKVLSLMDAVQGHFHTDLSIADVKDLADYLRSDKLQQPLHLSLTGAASDNSGQSSQPLLVSSWSDDRQWILIPTAGQNDFNQIHAYIKEQLK